MDNTEVLLSLVSQVQQTSPVKRVSLKSKSSTTKSSHPRSLIISRANEVFCQLCSFQNLLKDCYDAYVGYHQHIGDVINKRAEKSMYYTEDERLSLRDETVQFMSGIATIIQELSSGMDDITEKLNVSRLRHYQSVISDLMHKLNDISKLWDHMQKEQVRIHVKPCRLFAHLYQGKTEGQFIENSKTKSSLSTSASTSTSSKSHSGTVATSASAVNEMEDAKFAERYIDEIAPPAKMREYQAIAEQQRAALFKETQTLQQRFSEDLLVSMQLERTVMGISKMVTDFATLLESQAPMVEDIGEVAKDVKASMKSADAELLLTLERTQSQNWNMITLVFVLSGLLLFFHFITP